MAANSTVDEAELLDCIRCLVLDATRSEDDYEKTLSSQESDDDVDSSQEYQDLVNQVESKLTEFLEGQGGMGDGSETDVYKDDNTQRIVLPIHQPHAYPCRDTHKDLPSPPEDWPQRYEHELICPPYVGFD